MKKLFILIAIALFGCRSNPNKSEAIFEQDYCGWVVVNKGYKMPSNNSECRFTFLLEKDKERKEVFVLDNLDKKYELGDTICSK